MNDQLIKDYLVPITESINFIDLQQIWMSKFFSKMLASKPVEGPNRNIKDWKKENLEIRRDLSSNVIGSSKRFSEDDSEGEKNVEHMRKLSGSDFQSFDVLDFELFTSQIDTVVLISLNFDSGFFILMYFLQLINYCRKLSYSGHTLET